MTLNRFYCPDISDNIAELDSSQTRHVNVLRLKHSDKVEIIDGKGGLATGIIQKTGKKYTLVKIENFKTEPELKTGKLILSVSPSKGDRFDWMISKCTELGVDVIIPTIYERTVKLAKNPKTIKRWQNIAVSSIKQCKRLYLPEIYQPVSLQDAFKLTQSYIDKTNYFLCKPGKYQLSLDKLSLEGQNICSFIGPEGGITETEESYLMENKAEEISLNRNILRVETAAEAFCSIVGYAKVR